MPGWNSVICLPSRMTMASLPIRSMRLTWPSRLTRTHGQFSRDATCSMWLDLPVPWRPWTITRRLCMKPGEQRQRGVAVEDVVGIEWPARARRRGENAGTWRSVSILNSSRADSVMSGRWRALAASVSVSSMETAQDCIAGQIAPGTVGVALAPRPRRPRMSGHTYGDPQRPAAPQPRLG